MTTVDVTDDRPEPGHGTHYRGHVSGLESWDIVETLGFNLGNVVKYLWRAGLKTKSPLEDLRKARNYLWREKTHPSQSEEAFITGPIQRLLDFYDECETLSDTDDVIQTLLDPDMMGGSDWEVVCEQMLDAIDGMIVNVEAGIGIGHTAHF
jgi:Protein of unknwon function (DUF3310)